MRDADFYLENMPIAFCAVEILTGEDGRPVDYCLVYHNRAYARLAGLPYGTLNGKRGLEVRGHIDQELLMCCYDSAFHGKEHVLKDYSPDQEKHFLIYLYPLEDSLCGCVLQDVTENRRMELKLIHEHEKRKTFLKATTEIDFEYDFATETLAFGDGERVSEKNRVIKGGLKGLVENGIIREKDRGRIEDAFERLKAGNRAVEFNIQACLEGGGEYRWYAVSSSAYVEQKTGQLRVVGYLRNVEQMKDDVLSAAERSRSLCVSFCDPGVRWFTAPRFSIAYPEIQLKDDLYGGDDAARLLSERVYDLMVTPQRVRDARVQSVPFLRDQVYLSVPESSNLAQKAKFRSERYRRSPFCTRKSAGIF